MLDDKCYSLTWPIVYYSFICKESEHKNEYNEITEELKKKIQTAQKITLKQVEQYSLENEQFHSDSNDIIENANIIDDISNTYKFDIRQENIRNYVHYMLNVEDTNSIIVPYILYENKFDDRDTFYDQPGIKINMQSAFEYTTSMQRINSENVKYWGENIHDDYTVVEVKTSSAQDNLNAAESLEFINIDKNCTESIKRKYIDTIYLKHKEKLHNYINKLVDDNTNNLNMKIGTDIYKLLLKNNDYQQSSNIIIKTLNKFLLPSFMITTTNQFKSSLVPNSKNCGISVNKVKDSKILVTDLRNLQKLQLNFPLYMNEYLIKVIYECINPKRIRNNESIYCKTQLLIEQYLTEYITFRTYLKTYNAYKMQLESNDSDHNADKKWNKKTINKVENIIYNIADEIDLTTCPLRQSDLKGYSHAQMVKQTTLNTYSIFTSYDDFNYDHYYSNYNTIYKVQKIGANKVYNTSATLHTKAPSVRASICTQIGWYFPGMYPKMSPAAVHKLFRGEFRVGLFNAYFNFTYGIDINLCKYNKDKVQRDIYEEALEKDAENESRIKIKGTLPNMLFGIWTAQFPTKSLLTDSYNQNNTPSNVYSKIFDSIKSITLTDDLHMGLFEYSYESPTTMLPGMGSRIYVFYRKTNTENDTSTLINQNNESATSAQMYSDNFSNNPSSNLYASDKVQLGAYINNTDHDYYNPNIGNNLNVFPSEKTNNFQHQSIYEKDLSNLPNYHRSQKTHSSYVPESHYGPFANVKYIKETEYPSAFGMSIPVTKNRGIVMLKTSVGSSFISPHPVDPSEPIMTPKEYLELRNNLIQYRINKHTKTNLQLPSRKGYGDLLYCQDYRLTDFLLVRSNSYNSNNTPVTVTLKPLNTKLINHHSLPVTGVYLIGQVEPAIEIPGPEGKKISEWRKQWIEAYSLRQCLQGVQEFNQNKQKCLEFSIGLFDSATIARILNPLKKLTAGETLNSGHVSSANYLSNDVAIKVASEESIRKIVTPEQICGILSSQYGLYKLLDNGIKYIRSSERLTIARLIMLLREWISDAQWCRAYAMWTEFRKRLASLNILNNPDDYEKRLFSLPFLYRSLSPFATLNRSIVARYIEELIYYTPWQIYQNYSDIIAKKHSNFLQDTVFEYSIGRGEHITFLRDDICMSITRENTILNIRKHIPDTFNCTDLLEITYDPIKLLYIERMTRAIAENIPSDEIQETMIHCGFSISFVSSLSRAELISIYCRFAVILGPRNLTNANNNKITDIKSTQHNTCIKQVRFISSQHPHLTKKDLACLFDDYENPIVEDIENIIDNDTKDIINIDNHLTDLNNEQIVDIEVDTAFDDVEQKRSKTEDDNETNSSIHNIDESILKSYSNLMKLENNSTTTNHANNSNDKIPYFNLIYKDLWNITNVMKPSCKIGNIPRYQKIAYNASVVFNKLLDEHTRLYAKDFCNETTPKLVFPFTNANNIQTTIAWLKSIDDKNIVQFLQQQSSKYMPVIRWIRKCPMRHKRNKVIYIFGSQTILKFIEWRKKIIDRKYVTDDIYTKYTQFNKIISYNNQNEYLTKKASKLFTKQVNATKSGIDKKYTKKNKIKKSQTSDSLPSNYEDDLINIAQTKSLNLSRPIRLSHRQNKSALIRNLLSTYQSSGINAIKALNDSIYRCIYPITKIDKFVWFIDKVDEATAPDYYRKITSPIWIKMILEKSKKRRYRALNEVYEDLKRLKANCFYYNPPGHWLRPIVNDLYEYIEGEFKLEDVWFKILEKDISESKSLASDEEFSENNNIENTFSS